MNITQHTLIGDIVAQDYRASDIFEKYRIDFCCGGKTSLEAACAEKKLDVSKVIKELNDLPEHSGGDTLNYSSWPLPLLIDYIVSIHHNYLNKNTDIILAYARKIAEVHGLKHPEALKIAAIFSKIAEKMKVHLKEEEENFFPAVKKLASNSADESVTETIREFHKKLLAEHEEIGDAVHAIRALSNDYQVPGDVCNTFAVTYRKLKEFEDDLHKHVHLENNILFRKILN